MLRPSSSAPSIELFQRNPERPMLPGRLGEQIPLRRPVFNFGDLVGPLIVQGMLRRAGLDKAPARRPAQLLSVGSVIHFARPGAVVWGAGVSGKIDPAAYPPVPLDVRAVRGPLTRDVLIARGVDVPEVYGDPALLLPDLFPELCEIRRTRDVTIIPSLDDARVSPLRSVLQRRTLRPRRPVWTCLRTIASSRLVVGSSLYGIIIAEALGVPARLVRSPTESQLEDADYYAGTGRPRFTAAPTVEEALELGGDDAPIWSPDPLWDAFPTDLWGWGGGRPRRGPAL